MSGSHSRNKGKRGEREVAAIFADVFKGESIRRGWQARAGDDEPDVIMPWFWCEVKRGKAPRIMAAFRQSDDACGERKLMPIACTKEDRGEWMVTLRLTDLAELVGQLWEMMRR